MSVKDIKGGNWKICEHGASLVAYRLSRVYNLPRLLFKPGQGLFVARSSLLFCHVSAFVCIKEAMNS